LQPALPPSKLKLLSLRAADSEHSGPVGQCDSKFTSSAALCGALLTAALLRRRYIQFTLPNFDLLRDHRSPRLYELSLEARDDRGSGP
jgi:hypothetical protein